MILSMLGIKKSVLVYLGVTIFLIILNYIYSLFSNNISSRYMTYMFIYPLIGGFFINLFIIISKKVTEIKLFYVAKSIFNYGISTLVVGSFIKGIFEIAGTDSVYLVYYFYIGIILIIIGFLLILYSLYEVNNINR